MTIADFMHQHPWWSLIYFVILLGCAQALQGLVRVTVVKKNGYNVDCKTRCTCKQEVTT